MTNVSMIDGHIDEPKMTDNEIKKYLEWYVTVSGRIGSATVDSVKLSSILNYINRLEAEKQDLEIKFNTMRGVATYYQTEVERLKQNLKEAHIDIKEQKETVKRLQGYIQSLHEEYLIF